MRVFAHEYASEVLGVVLVDSMNPKQVTPSQSNFLARVYSLQAAFARVGGGQLLVKLGILPGMPPSEAAYWPQYVRPGSLRASASEFHGLPASAAEAAAVKTFGDLPLIVLTAKLNDNPGWPAWQAELNLVIYICKGKIRGVDLFRASEIAYRDPRRKPGLISIYDMLYVVENITLEDMRLGIQRLERATDPKLRVGPRVLLTRSEGIHLFVESMNLQPTDVQIQIDACDSLEDAVAHLGLVDHQGEVIRFWEECNSQFDSA